LGPAFGEESLSLLTSRHARVRFRLRKHLIGSHMRWSRGQHLFFAVNQIAGVETGQLKTMTMGNRIGGTRLHTIPAKYTSIVIDVVDTSVTFGARDSGFGGVFRSLYIDAIRGTGGGAEETGYTFFQSVFVALQDVHAAESLLNLCAFQGAGTVGIILDDRWLKHLLQGDRHSLGDGSDVSDHGHASLL
jgi:hypothetical protein